jgi:hypothetical protein
MRNRLSGVVGKILRIKVLCGVYRYLFPFLWNMKQQVSLLESLVVRRMNHVDKISTYC